MNLVSSGVCVGWNCLHPQTGVAMTCGLNARLQVLQGVARVAIAGLARLSWSRCEKITIHQQHMNTKYTEFGVFRLQLREQAPELSIQVLKIEKMRNERNL